MIPNTPTEFGMSSKNNIRKENIMAEQQKKRVWKDGGWVYESGDDVVKFSKPKPQPKKEKPATAPKPEIKPETKPEPQPVRIQTPVPELEPVEDFHEGFMRFKDGRVIKYPDFFKDLGYEIAEAEDLYHASDRAVFLDKDKRVLHTKKESVESEYPVFFSSKLLNIISAIVIETPDPGKKYYLYGRNEIDKMADHPNGHGFCAIWSPYGLIYVGDIAKTQDGTYEARLSEFAPFGPLTAFLMRAAMFLPEGANDDLVKLFVKLFTEKKNIA